MLYHLYAVLWIRIWIANPNPDPQHWLYEMETTWGPCPPRWASCPSWRSPPLCHPSSGRPPFPCPAPRCSSRPDTIVIHYISWTVCWRYLVLGHLPHPWSIGIVPIPRRTPPSTHSLWCIPTWYTWCSIWCPISTAIAEQKEDGWPELIYRWGLQRII